MSPLLILPPEIWLHIAKFLPSKELKRLYGVSRMFMELALTEKYGMITLFGVRKEEESRYTRYLAHVIEPHVLQRISHLRICLDFNFIPTSQGFRSKLSPLLSSLRLFARYPFDSYIRRMLISSIYNDRRFYIRVTKLLDRLSASHITRLTLFFSEEPLWRRYRSSEFISKLWTAVSQSLRFLELGGIPQRLVDSMVPPKLPLLESMVLNTTYTGLYPTLGGDSAIASKMAQIVNVYSSTLRSLSLIMNTEAIDVGSFFASISTCPNLTMFSLSVGDKDPNYTHDYIRHFLRCHASQLTKLEIPTPGPSKSVEPPSSSIDSTIPQNAHVLSFFPSHHRRFAEENVRDYIQPSVNTLTSLVLDHPGYSFETLITLLGLFPVENVLSHLHIQCMKLRFPLLTYLAERFRHLRSLTVILTMALKLLHSYQSQDALLWCSCYPIMDLSSNVPEEDIAVMRNWTLLTITLRLSRFDSCKIEKGKLKSAIPNLETIEVQNDGHSIVDDYSNHRTTSNSYF